MINCFIVPTTSPTLHPPTMQPTMTNAPYKPISKPITGFVTRNQYQATGSSCKGLNPLTVTGFATNTCLMTGGNPSVLSVMYTCDSGKHRVNSYARISLLLFVFYRFDCHDRIF